MTNLGIDQLAPRDGPASGGSWKNHGESASTVAFAAVDSYKSLEFVHNGESFEEYGVTPEEVDRAAQRDLAAIQKDGKAGRLKPWKPRPTIYCRAGFERRYKNL
jgi:hypothetical protein